MSIGKMRGHAQEPVVILQCIVLYNCVAILRAPETMSDDIEQRDIYIIYLSSQKLVSYHIVPYFYIPVDRYTYKYIDDRL